MAVIAMQSASSGLRALDTRLDVIANNLANVNTEGFKSSRVNFEDLMYIEQTQPGVENNNGDQRPTGLYVGLGVRVSGTQQDFKQGPPVPGTSNTDMMIQGNGFFRVKVENDLSSDGYAYTRVGNFVTNANGDLTLANSDGRLLDPPINIPNDAINVAITSSGLVQYTSAGGTTTDAGQIQLANFINPSGLSQMGGNLWVESAASGSVITGDPGTLNFGKINAGVLEGSNVDPSRELIELIRTQRAFEMNSQAIRAADETLQSVAQLRR